ncbi:hypothetical protein ACIP25_30675 [Streptomyces massasporeus]|uniref:hypothetical protein n=1 Tax=Streptomyces massasporeus TaxID=67324 RepID=UPI0037F45AEB
MSDDSGNGVRAAVVSGVFVLIAALIAAVVNWPEDWWPNTPPKPPNPKVHVTDVWPDTSSWVVSRKKDDLTPPSKNPCDEGNHDWVRSIGGVETKISIHFVLTTESPESVVITGLRPHAKRVATPKMQTGIRLYCPSGDGFLGRIADLTVDSNPPKFTLYDEDYKPLRRIGLNLDKGDAADFLLNATVNSAGAVYEFTADLELLVGGDRMTLPINDRGKPFRVAGALPAGAPVVSLKMPEYQP